MHGLLPDKVDDSALHRLVLTSGDFGLAYLTERWAARFVGELFRNYVVCFVGYSINDPVLRYMMDAIAADRLQGEDTPQAYALGDCEPGQERHKTIEWEAKGVSPILYEVPSGSGDHSGLHKTLKAWAETYRDGTLGTERIVVDNAHAHPSASSKQDDFVGRMLWALSHESGLPAKRFAELNPVPSIAWLEAFSKDRYQFDDLHRFGVWSGAETDETLRFSLIHRPAPYKHALWMSLVSRPSAVNQWDDRIFHLARWLVRHMNDPALVIWFAQRGGQLNERWSRLIEDELDRFARLEKDGNTPELKAIRINAPNAIPSPMMQLLWRLLLTGRVKSPWYKSDLYHWKARVNRVGLTATLRFEFRDLLAPKVALKEPFRWDDRYKKPHSPERLKQLVDWELVLASDHVHTSLRDLTDERWRRVLPAQLEDLQLLLHDALDLLRELGDADDRRDPSHWDMPSIMPHWQNRGFRDWVVLIELLRDAWLATHSDDLRRATRIAQNWFNLPYPTFKRLALFSATQDGCIPAKQWVDWLIADDAWWLWSKHTKRETLRLLVLRGGTASPKLKAELEEAIVAGPPVAMYPDENEPERRDKLIDHSVWLRLAKLKEGSGHLGDTASRRLADLSAAHPELKLARNESDEFSIWMSSTGDPDFEKNLDVNIAPRKRQELVKWLKETPPAQRPFSEDTWRETCRTRFFHSFSALCDLSQEGLWPTERWREALQAWSQDDNIMRSWVFGATLMQSIRMKRFSRLYTASHGG